ncbi:hypothetical protein SS50377_21228 [Spironucleus salmonicida]|uniref:Uncharacterized protein n=1 Tax=Spironucleus salmonicida TaxID=348837 RepID=V6LJV4_9EUKA|nr:hypothetical protein SS50377_21228 [Spironucleus salmonicida]|eukprot:EST44001.1 Hypothetical protein SS50377_16310 [Spironucleus salmonicida]
MDSTSFAKSILLDNGCLKTTITSNNEILKKFNQLKPYLVQLKDENLQLKSILQSKNQEKIEILEHEKQDLSAKISHIRLQLKFMQETLEQPPSEILLPLQQENIFLKLQLTKFSSLQLQNPAPPRHLQTPLDTFLLNNEALHQRADSTLRPPKQLISWFKALASKENCVSSLRQQTQVIKHNTLLKSEFLLTFQVPFEIAKSCEKYQKFIRAHLLSKWCLRFEKTALQFIENLPEIQCSDQRALDKRMFAADQQHFGSGIVTNFLIFMLLIQGFEFGHDKGGLNFARGEKEEIIYF